MRLRSQTGRNRVSDNVGPDDAPVVNDQISARLVDSGELSDADLDRIAAHQARTGMSLADAAVDLGLVAPDAINRALAVQAQSGLIDKEDGRVSPAVVAAFDPLDPLALKLRALRATLFPPTELRGPGARILVLVGVGTDETPGIAANLAVLVAQLGFHGLLVDANFDSPAHHNLFGVGGEEGVTSILSSGNAQDAAIVATPVPNLDLLPAGPAIPALSETLERVQLVTQLRSLRRGHRFIIIDAGDQAPDMLTALCRGADGVLVAAERKRSSITALRIVIDRLRDNDIDVLGTILAR